MHDDHATTRYGIARGTLIVALVALAAAIPGLMNDFVYDDTAIIRDNARLHDLARLGELVTSPYWPPPFVEQLYRPVALVLLALQYAVGGGHPIVFRIVSCVIYVACAVGVFRLGSRLLPATAAVALAVLFAAHPVHVEAAALGVNQGEMVVALIALLMTIRYLDRRRAGLLGAADWAILIMLYCVAALTKETGFILPVLLACAELTLVTRPSLRSRADETIVGFAWMAAAAAVLFLLRASILPDSAVSVVPAVDLRGLSLAGRVGALMEIVPTWFRLLTFPATLRANYHLASVEWQALALRALGLVLASSAFVVMYRARRAAPVVAFGIGWTIVALLPVSNLIPTGVLIGERTLFLPSVGFLLAVGGAGVALVRRRPDPAVRRRLLALCAVLAALGLVKSAVRQLSWNSAHVRVAPRTPGGPPAR